MNNKIFSTPHIPPILKSFICENNQLTSVTGKIPSFTEPDDFIERMKKIRSAERKKKIDYILRG